MTNYKRFSSFPKVSAEVRAEVMKEMRVISNDNEAFTLYFDKLLEDFHKQHEGKVSATNVHSMRYDLSRTDLVPYNPRNKLLYEKVDESVAPGYATTNLTATSRTSSNPDPAAVIASWDRYKTDEY